MDDPAPEAAPAQDVGPAAPVRPLLWVAALSLVAGLVLALWAAGTARPPLVGDPGPTVRWGLPLVTGLGRGAAALTVGALVLCATVLPTTQDAGRTWARVARWSVLSAAAWLLLQVLQLLLTFRDVVGGGPLVPPAAQLAAFLDLGVGRTLAAATVLTALVAVGALVARQPGEAAVVLALAAAALLQQAGAGHAGSSAGHGVAVLGLWAHIVAACVWVGALAVLVLLAPRLLGPSTTLPGLVGSGSALSLAAGRYSTLAGWAYAVLTLLGVFSLTVRASSPGDVLTSTWGRLLLVKVVALGALGLIGLMHRRHTLPLLERGESGAFRRLATGEVLVMAAVLGLSSALARTGPPHTAAPAEEPVVALTGYAAPPPPTVLTFLTEVRVEPVSLLLAGSALLVYLLGVRRLRGAGQGWPWRRTASAVVGVVGLVWATSGGLAVYGSVLLSAHLAQHLVLVTVLPVAYVLAAPMTLARRALRPREDGSRGPLEWLEAATGGPHTGFLGRPVVASLHVAAALAVLYLTPVLWLVLTSQVLHLVAVLYLSAVGLILAASVLRAPPATSPAPTPPLQGWHRAALLVPYLAVLALLGLHLWTRTLHPEPGFYTRLSLPWLADPLVDQRRAAVVAWVLGGLGALVLGGRWRPARPTDLYHGRRARAPGSV